jgi:hypothetical protein
MIATYRQIATTARSLADGIATGTELMLPAGDVSLDGLHAIEGCLALRRAAISARGQVPTRRFVTEEERSAAHLLEFLCLRVEAAVLVACSDMSDPQRVGEVLGQIFQDLHDLASRAELNAARGM